MNEKLGFSSKASQAEIPSSKLELLSPSSDSIFFVQREGDREEIVACLLLEGLRTLSLTEQLTKEVRGPINALAKKIMKTEKAHYFLFLDIEEAKQILEGESEDPLAEIISRQEDFSQVSFWKFSLESFQAVKVGP